MLRGETQGTVMYQALLGGVFAAEAQRTEEASHGKIEGESIPHTEWNLWVCCYHVQEQREG